MNTYVLYCKYHPVDPAVIVQHRIGQFLFVFFSHVSNHYYVLQDSTVQYRTIQAQYSTEFAHVITVALNSRGTSQWCNN